MPVLLGHAGTMPVTGQNLLITGFLVKFFPVNRAWSCYFNAKATSLCFTFKAYYYNITVYSDRLTVA